MKLYSYPGACSTATHIVLNWSGLPFSVELVGGNGAYDEAKFAEVRSLNPTGMVPLLVDGDFVLSQNAAIFGYISHLAPQARLFGDGDARQRGEAMRWLMFSNSDLHPIFKPLFRPADLIEDESQHEALRKNAHRSARALFEIADRQLSGRSWLAGFRSAADAHFYLMLCWAGMFGIDLGGLDNLAAFKRRMEADAGVYRALKAEGLIQ